MIFAHRSQSSVAYQRNCVLYVNLLHFRLRRESNKTIDRRWHDRWNETSYCRRCQFLNCFCTCWYRNWIIYTRSLYITSLITSSRDKESHWVCGIWSSHNTQYANGLRTFHKVLNKNESDTVHPMWAADVKKHVENIHSRIRFAQRKEENLLNYF